MQVSSIKTYVPDNPSSSEVIVIQSNTSSSLTSHITMLVPSYTMTQTSSLIYTAIDVPPIDEIRDDSNEYFVIYLGEYRYRKYDISVVKRGKRGVEIKVRWIHLFQIKLYGLNDMVINMWMLQALLLS